MVMISIGKVFWIFI